MWGDRAKGTKESDNRLTAFSGWRGVSSAAILASGWYPGAWGLTAPHIDIELHWCHEARGSLSQKSISEQP